MPPTSSALQPASSLAPCDLVSHALGPVIADEQQSRPHSLHFSQPAAAIRENRQRPNGSVLAASAGHDTPSAVTSPRWLAGALSSARSCVRGNRSAHLPAATRQ